MEILFEVVQALICIFEAYIMFDFFDVFFHRRKLFQSRYTAMAMIFIVSLLIYGVNACDSSVINILSMQIIYASLIFLVFEGSIFKRLLYDFLANVLMAGSEFLLILLMSIPSDFSMQQVQDNKFSMMISLIGIKALSFIMFNIVKRISKGTGNKMDLKTLLLYSVLPIAMLCVMVATAYLKIDFETFSYVRVLLVAGCVLGLIGEILIFSAFDNYSVSVEELQQHKLMLSKIELEQKYYSQLECMNQEHAQILHDIHHYLSIIGAAAVEGRNTEILEILSELQVQFDHSKTEIICQDKILNTILNEKKKAAQRKGICMDIVVEPQFSVKKILDIDVIPIVGNLLDNAIEAAEKCEEGKIEAFFYEQNFGNFSVMKICNNYIGEIRRKDELLLTNKEDEQHHGIGIRSVQRVVEKYDGVFQYFYEDGFFTAIVILQNSTKKR